MFKDSGLDALQISTLLFVWSAVSFLLEVPSGVIADNIRENMYSFLLKVAGLLVISCG